MNSKTRIQIKKSRKNIAITCCVLLAVLLAAFIISCVILRKYPYLWREKTKVNRNAIIEYAGEHYPGAVIVDEYYESAKVLVTKIPRDYIKFEWNDIEFNICTQDGQVIIDGYYEARATAQIDNIIEAGFLKPRNIIAGTNYRFHDDYRETYPYTGSLYVELRANGATPQEIGWLYDFYMYWKEEGAFFREYQVNFKIYEGGVEKGHMVFRNDSEFANEDEFYSAFKYY